MRTWYIQEKISQNLETLKIKINNNCTVLYCTKFWYVLLMLNLWTHPTAKSWLDKHTIAIWYGFTAEGFLYERDLCWSWMTAPSTNFVFTGVSFRYEHCTFYDSLISHLGYVVLLNSISSQVLNWKVQAVVLFLQRGTSWNYILITTVWEQLPHSNWLILQTSDIFLNCTEQF